MDIHKNVRDTTPEEIAAAHQADIEAQGAFGVRYLRWWFNRDLGSVYCLVDAPDADAAIGVHRRAHGLLPDEIIPIEAGQAESLIGPDEHGPAVREDPPDRISEDTAFRTVVFTDLEGSTTMTQRLGDEAALALLRRHDELMHACLADHAGSMIKHTGDGVMASFSSVARAVECMISMQHALARHNEEHDDVAMHARMGAAAGEPVSHMNDLFGATVQLAARLCSHAGAGQIMVAGVVRDLCIGKTFAFQERGAISLKGFEEQVRVYEVHWRG